MRGNLLQGRRAGGAIAQDFLDFGEHLLDFVIDFNASTPSGAAATSYPFDIKSTLNNSTTVSSSSTTKTRLGGAIRI
jgi:hypothetical protein